MSESLPARSTTKLRHAHVMKGGELRQNVYARIAAQIDAMALDSVLRISDDIAPSSRLVYQRADLNNFTIIQRNFNGQRIVVRIA